jgi:CRISPR-associated protein Cas1
MAWKGLHLSRPSRLSVADAQIVVAQDEGEVRVALEDVAYVILDTAHATLSASLLSACMESGVAIIVTDARHMPSGLLLPFHSHHRQSGVANLQSSASEPLRKQCWRRIVVAKIENQATHLGNQGRPAASVVRAMSKHVGSGDPDNVEARAARAYWSALFDNFTRDDQADLRNKLLNYGYAVMRAAIARALVAFGCLPALGVHHASITNAFNLADDFIEPYRPFVDAMAAELAKGRALEEEMKIDDRRALAGVLQREARLNGEKFTLLAASEKTVESFVRALEGASAALLRLPDMPQHTETAS